MDFTRRRHPVGNPDRRYVYPMPPSAAAPRPPVGPRRARRGVGLLAATLVVVGLTTGCATGPGTIDAEDGEMLAEGLAGPPRTPAPAPAASTAPADPGDPAATASSPSADGRSEVGALVPGFPEDLLPLPDDAAILVTSAVPVGEADVQEVSLNLRTSWSASRVLTLYRDALVAAGFTEVPGTTTDGDLAGEATFTRSGGDELVSVGVLDVDGRRTVTLGGRVRTAL